MFSVTFKLRVRSTPAMGGVPRDDRAGFRRRGRRRIISPRSGEPIEIEAGDVLYFPENSRGTWKIIETVRKAYLCYDLRK